MQPRGSYHAEDNWCRPSIPDWAKEPAQTLAEHTQVMAAVPGVAPYHPNSSQTAGVKPCQQGLSFAFQTKINVSWPEVADLSNSEGWY